MLNHAAVAQELEPACNQNAPTGMNVVALGYVYSNGNVLVDAALPSSGTTTPPPCKN